MQCLAAFLVCWEQRPYANINIKSRPQGCREPPWPRIVPQQLNIHLHLFMVVLLNTVGTANDQLARDRGSFPGQAVTATTVARLRQELLAKAVVTGNAFTPPCLSRLVAELRPIKSTGARTLYERATFFCWFSKEVRWCRSTDDPSQKPHFQKRWLQHSSCQFNNVGSSHKLSKQPLTSIARRRRRPTLQHPRARQGKAGMQFP